jgi:hypothetical protein
MVRWFDSEQTHQWTPRVQVGVETAMHVLLKNPCDHPVAVRLLPLPLLASQEEFNAAHDALAGGDHRDDEHDLLAMPRLLREASPAFKLHGARAHPSPTLLSDLPVVSPPCPMRARNCLWTPTQRLLEP